MAAQNNPILTNQKLSECAIREFPRWFEGMVRSVKSDLELKAIELDIDEQNAEAATSVIDSLTLKLYDIFEKDARRDHIVFRFSGERKKTLREFDDIFNINNRQSSEKCQKPVDTSAERSFFELVSRLKETTAMQRKEIAKSLEGPLNSYLSCLPADTLEEKKAICAKVEEILEPLGLAVEIPREPYLPGKLKATTGDYPEKGCFQFQVMVDGKQKKPATSNSLPTLKLIDTHREVRPSMPTESTNPAKDWQGKIGPKSTRSGRKVE